MEFLAKLGLETVQTFTDFVLKLFDANQNQQVLQKVGQVDDQV